MCTHNGKKKKNKKNEKKMWQEEWRKIEHFVFCCLFFACIYLNVCGKDEWIGGQTTSSSTFTKPFSDVHTIAIGANTKKERERECIIEKV